MIKNIIFDFGGVIYDIDHNRSKEAFANLGLTNFAELYGHAVQTHLFEDFETGLVSPSVFRAEIQKHIPAKTSDQKIDAAWNALLIGFKSERLDLLEKAAKHYRLFLLSNTNQIHYQQYMAELKEQNRLEKFIGLFERLYFSHQIGLRKPDAKIFNYVLMENSLNPKETVFIDDYDLNIFAAEKAGLQGLLLKPEQDVCSLFTSKGQLID